MLAWRLGAQIPQELKSMRSGPGESPSRDVGAGLLVRAGIKWVLDVGPHRVGRCVTGGAATGSTVSDDEPPRQGCDDV